MNIDSVLLLGITDLALIGALPRIFFRRGTLTPQWWLTASPFFAAFATLVGAATGYIAPTLGTHAAAAAVAVVLHAGSIFLIGLTLGTHREPLSLWHQPNDTPRQLVTHGAYSRIRHPFYTAFLMALLGAALACPHWVTLVAFTFGLVQLNRTAAREERILMDSPLGASYRQYHSRTGRFLPRSGFRRGIALRPGWSR